MKDTQLNIAISQIAPVWLNKEPTTLKIIQQIDEAGAKGVQLIVFGEGLLPGYPFWVELTDGARFDSGIQKELYAYYVQEAVQISRGDLQPVCEAALRNKTAVYLGCIERAADRGSHSLYCSLVYINREGGIGSVHRKLVPTYEERLVWSNGDGNGLVVHPLEAFTVGGLNCWENWVPLARTTFCFLRARPARCRRLFPQTTKRLLVAGRETGRLFSTNNGCRLVLAVIAHLYLITCVSCLH